MRRLVEYLRHEMRLNAAVLAVLVVWCINASFNYSMGRATGGGGIEGVLYGGALVALAALGAYAATAQQTAAGAKKLSLWVMVAVQLVVGQFAGWQALGLNLSRGAAQLEAKAVSRNTVDEQIKALRAERSALGQVRPVAAIRAEKVLECGRTSARYPDGNGPKCTALKAELAKAERLRAIEAQLPGLVQKIQAGPQIKNPDVAYEVPAVFAGALASWAAGEPRAVSSADVRFGWTVFLVAALEFVATLGWWLAGVGAMPAGQRAKRTGLTPQQLRDEQTPGGVWMPHGGGNGGGSGGPGGGGVTHNDAPPAAASMQASVVPSGSGAGAGSQQSSLHGAPIHINFHGGGVPQQIVADTPRGTVDEAEVVATPGKLVRQLPSLPGGPPVDRTRVARAISDDERAAADVILAFDAACLVETEGGVLSARDVFARYQHWAGERAVEADAFHDLLAAVTGRAACAIGGLPHYRGLALVAAPQLTVVA